MSTMRLNGSPLKLAVERRNDDERVADLEALHFEAAPVPENGITV